ncbi:threonine/serine dehydratase [Kineosporia rhizophila]|uniref:threonine/serine dehydratase n=1 Tax=Kineosporia TaxID=49184 RepID=UPI001E3108EB|nr:threonine/serine dehydratase [Kineosporia sp. NBRC 101677]MCE0539117.1 threonine/serine dehydratase [Kineosporia rhizophila]GLY18121.1 serine/threonine dehydratase [Kineosporia sp. NBRC 101677]
MITRDDVLSARTRIAPYIRHTPLLAAEGLWFKCEFLQKTGVFKTRGAFNRQLAAQERGELDPQTGIVTASGGNAGLANAYAASVLGVRATVFVPQTAPAVKVARLRGYGAEVVQVGTEYAEAYAAATAHVASTGALFCHAYDQPEIVAGAGTLAEEILDDAPDVDTIVVAVGGAGLFAGIAASAEHRAKVVAVETEHCPTLHSALAAGEPVDIAVSGVAADSLGARRVGDIGWNLAQRTSPTSVLVSDEAVVEARHQLWRDYRIPAEHGAATAYAALTSGAYVPAEGEKVAVVICGANTDPATLV